MELFLGRGRRWAASVALAFASLLVLELLAPYPIYWTIWIGQIRADYSHWSHVTPFLLVASVVSLVSWTLVWYGLLSLLVFHWKRSHRRALNSGGVGRWIGSAALTFLSMVVVGWPAIDYVEDIDCLNPIYLLTANVVGSMFLSVVADESELPTLWKFAFICVTIVSWMLVWYAAISVLLRGIKRIRFRA